MKDVKELSSIELMDLIDEKIINNKQMRNEINNFTQAKEQIEKEKARKEIYSKVKKVHGDDSRPLKALKEFRQRKQTGEIGHDEINEYMSSPKRE